MTWKGILSLPDEFVGVSMGGEGGKEGLLVKEWERAAVWCLETSIIDL